MIVIRFSEQTKPVVPPTTVTDIRLPTDLEPVLYNVELKPNMYDGPVDQFTFDGYVAIHLLVKNPTDKITLHMADLTLDNSSITLDSSFGSSAPRIMSYDIDMERQFVIFNLNSSLEQDREYVIKMNFTGPFQSTLVGLYLSQYQRDNETV